MKKFYLLLMALCLITTANAQNINFPDANFKAKLLQSSPGTQIARNLNGYYFAIDVNSDGEIQVDEATQVKTLNIPNSNISNLTGISNFNNLTELICGSNLLSSLDVSGMTSLVTLNCPQNQLTSLTVSGLTNLVTLSCSRNQLTSLNLSGLYNLSELRCSFNNLTALNLSNQSSLISLYCGYNHLTALDVSNLTSLEWLDCNGNDLTSLNVSNLTNLYSLYCNDNDLTSLNISGIPYLLYLDCSYNNLTSLSNLAALNTLRCSGNQIVSLDVNSSANLRTLWCNDNLLTTLNLNNLTEIGDLNYSNNNLPSLDLTHLTNLTDLRCQNNQITTLNLNGLTNINSLRCDGNLISELDARAFSNFDTVSFSNNPNLTNVYLKNGINEGIVDDGVNPLLEGVPNLRFICTDEFQVEDTIALLNTLSGFENCVVSSYCSFTPGGEYFTIQGSTKYDNNNDGCDVSDSVFQNLKFSIADGTNTGIFMSNASGNYSNPVQAGTYTITSILENPAYFNVSPATVNVTFPTQSSPFTQNFCVTANGIHPDLEVALLSSRPARPGFDAIYKLVYKNKGTNAQSGTINLTFNDDVLDFVLASPIVSNQTINNLSWDFTNLQPYETREITVTLNVNSPTETPAINNGDILNYTVNITSTTTDETPNDNTFVFNQTVVNSFDPNDKTCLEGATIAPSEVGKYVHYMIRFENTGTFPAQNIVVKDMIDTDKFDINSLVPIKGSHSFVTNITSGNKVEFIFENINLPFDDANNDGYVVFKIKTKPTLVVGNTFSNSANIYFDYNFPIVTNTATTTIQALSTQDFGFVQYFSLYPNPVKDVLNIETKQSIEVTSINIYNQLGQLVLVVPSAQNISKVDVSNLSSGNYFIKINSDKGVSNTKFIKQ